MQFAAALSEHPVAALAVGEVAGEILEKIGPQTDLLFVFATQDHAGALEDIAPALQQLLQPKVMVGCLAEGVIGPYQEVLDSPGLAVWAANGCEAYAEVLQPGQEPATFASNSTLILLADEKSFDAEPLINKLNRTQPDIRVVGGYTGGQRFFAPGSLVHNGQLIKGGAIAVVLSQYDSAVESVLTPGARMIGEPFAITKINGPVVSELAGASAVKRLSDILQAEYDNNGIDLTGEPMFIGRVIDESQDEFGTGDFAITQVSNFDAIKGTITLSDEWPVGTIVQFHVGDDRIAKLSLIRSLSDVSARAGLLFASTFRLLDAIDQSAGDAELIGESLESPQLAGILTSKEFGTLRAINVVTELSASLALFS